MKIVLEKVKIYGYDPSNFKVFTNNGKESKQYSVPLIISPEQRNLIDSYIYGKCSINDKQEILFYGKSKQMIPVFDDKKNKIEKPLKEVFIADVSILIDVFTTDEGEDIRYSKCLGIKYICPVPEEKPRIFVGENYNTFEEIFGENENKEEKNPNYGLQTKEAEKPTSETTKEVEPENDDLPF